MFSETCGASRSPAKQDLGFLWEPAVCPTFPHPIPTPRAEPWSPTRLPSWPNQERQAGAIRARQGWRRGDWRVANPAPRLLLLFSVPAAGPGAPIALKKAAVGGGHPGEGLPSQRPQPASQWGQRGLLGKRSQATRLLPTRLLSKTFTKGHLPLSICYVQTGMVTSRGRLTTWTTVPGATDPHDS